MRPARKLSSGYRNRARCLRPNRPDVWRARSAAAVDGFGWQILSTHSLVSRWSKVMRRDGASNAKRYAASRALVTKYAPPAMATAPPPSSINSALTLMRSVSPPASALESENAA